MKSSAHIRSYCFQEFMTFLYYFISGFLTLLQQHKRSGSTVLYITLMFLISHCMYCTPFMRLVDCILYSISVQKKKKRKYYVLTVIADKNTPVDNRS